MPLKCHRINVIAVSAGERRNLVGALIGVSLIRVALIGIGLRRILVLIGIGIGLRRILVLVGVLVLVLGGIGLVRIIIGIIVIIVRILVQIITEGPARA